MPGINRREFLGATLLLLTCFKSKGKPTRSTTEKGFVVYDNWFLLEEDLDKLNSHGKWNIERSKSIDITL